jgi:PPP family 3-phenylpropionic acid transporter
MYAAYGVASPFLPAFVSARGLPAEDLGLVLAAGTAVRLLSAPLAGRAGDLLQNLRLVLVLCVSLSAIATLGYLEASELRMFLVVTLFHAATLAPMPVLADALALGNSTPPAGSGRKGFEYGWVRGSGSAAFIVATLISGQAIAAFGLDMIIWLQAVLLATAAFAALFIPEVIHGRTAAAVLAPAGGVMVLLRIPRFRHLVIVAALILGSHAMHDAFAVIRWTAAGIGPATSSLLWSIAVAAEILVFFLVGPALVTRLTPAGAIALAAVAGAVRWTVMALTSDVFALALVQPLHGFTFALLHLSCMRVIARTVPSGLEGTAQALYATLGIGAATALLTFLSGALYARLGAQGFWFMAALCVTALPLARKVREGPRNLRPA